MEGGFSMIPCGIIDAQGWVPFTPQLTEIDGMQVLFASTEHDNCGFDVFGAVFWMLTRYEEYGLRNQLDLHGRIKASDCLMVQHEQHLVPWVDYWFAYLGKRLKTLYPKLNIIDRRFSSAITIDIDNAYAFAGKGFKRNMGGILKDTTKFKLARAFERFGVVCGFTKDPYDTYLYIEKQLTSKDISVIFFFLLADHAPFDKNLPYTSSRLIKLIRYLNEKYESGIHPGYQSHLDGIRSEAEIHRIAGITGKPVTHSRNHFLRLQVPETYRILSQANVAYDHTMGFAELAGFRAGTCIPYSMYDLELDQDTFVKVVPFAYMDGTLNEYMKLNPVESNEIIAKLIKSVQEVGGHFECIWHNETLNNQRAWKGWHIVFENTIAALSSDR